MSEKIPNDINSRKLWIDDFLKKKGIYKSIANLTPEQKITLAAIQVWEEVRRQDMVPLLSSLQKPSDYIPNATQRLFCSDFQRKFSQWGKDELVFLISAMHAEELEKQCNQIVSQGMIGINYGKKI